jgi:hypothetical protein
MTEAKSGSVRRAGGEDDREHELKPLVAIQRVRLPPGKGRACQPEASFARYGNGSVKRKTAGAEAYGLAPKSANVEAFAVRIAGGSIDATVSGEGASVRPGSWNGAKARDGSPEDLRDPIRVHARTSRRLGRPVQAKALARKRPPLLWERAQRTRMAAERVGIGSEPNQRPWIRGWEVVAPS